MIEVSHLTKLYGDHAAVRDLSFTIEPGQIYGLLGPNGAGKSTTMNIMTGCLAATEGEVKINGYDIFEDATKAKKLIGYLPEMPPLYSDRTPEEYLYFVARAKGIAKDKIDDEIGRAMSVTGITDVYDRLIKHLSKGYKQRVGIAQALLGNPEIIILDEPTVGLDPQQIIEIRDLIKELGKEHTVILSSHILSEVQAVCQTILIISKGRLVACDSPENLEKLFSGTPVLNLKVEAGEEEARQILSGFTYITDITCEPCADSTDSDKTTLRIETDAADADEASRDFFFAFAKEGKAILEMSRERASLEEVFIELTAKDAEIKEPAEEETETAEEETAPDEGEGEEPAPDTAPAAEDTQPGSGFGEEETARESAAREEEADK